MHGLVFYIGLGLGLAAACGLRPFLPALLAGALASAGALGVSFTHGGFRFLQEGWWLALIALLLVLAYALELLGRRTAAAAPAPAAGVEPLRAAVAGIGYGVGALLFAGTLATHGDAWWAGLIGGLAAAALADRAAEPIVSAARRRLPDRGARTALLLYLDAAALLAAGLAALLHPLGYVTLAGLLWLLVRGRARAGGKYAGLRVLRR